MSADDPVCGPDDHVVAGEAACVLEGVADLLDRAAGDDQDDSMRSDSVTQLRGMARHLVDAHPQGRMLASDREGRAWAARLAWLLDGATNRAHRTGDP